MDAQRMLRNLLSYTSASCEEDVIESNKLYEELLAYINKSELLKIYVARYFDLLENYEDYTNEFRLLYEKLSKVGKEE